MVRKDIVIYPHCAILGHLGKLDALGLWLRGFPCVSYAAATCYNRKEESHPGLVQPLKGAPYGELVTFVDESGPVEDGA
jgi:hypothetical protein